MGDQTTIGALTRGQGLETPAGLADHPVVDKYYLLVIAIDEYAAAPNGTPWQELNNAVYDAAGVTEFLLGKYRFHRPAQKTTLPSVHGRSVNQYEALLTKCLYNKAATKANIFNHLVQVKAAMGPDDALLVYFSGHGVSRDGITYLVPYATNQEEFYNWVNWTELSAMFSNYEADQKGAHLLLLLDCCFAGNLVRGQVDSNEQYFSRYILTASSSNQSASDGIAGAGGPFANKLVSILEDNTRPYISLGQLNAVNAMNAHFAAAGLTQRVHYALLPGVRNGQGEFIFELAEKEIPPVPLLGRTILENLDFNAQKGSFYDHFLSPERPINLITTFGHPMDAHKLLGKILFRWLFDTRVVGRIPLSSAGLRYLEIQLTSLGSDDTWGSLIRMLAPSGGLREFTHQQCVEWIFNQVKEGIPTGQARHLVVHFGFEVGSTQLFEQLEQFYLDFQTRYLQLYKQLDAADQKKIGRVFILFSDERAEAEYTPFSPDEQPRLLMKYGASNLNLIAPPKIQHINHNHIYAWLQKAKESIQTTNIQQLEATQLFDPATGMMSFEINDVIDRIITYCGVSPDALIGFLFDFENKHVYDQ